MKDVLSHFYNALGFDRSNIKDLVFGEKYTCILLKNGQIGVCANLEHHIQSEKLYSNDLSDRTFRIVYNAYLNANLNYHDQYLNTLDIFQAIDFKKHTDIVMIGFFGPLYEKFEKAGIGIKVFDQFKSQQPMTSLDEMPKALKKSKAVILTATSMANQTFNDVIRNTGNDTEIYLLGPSCILHKDLYRVKNIKALFGTIFEKNDKHIPDIIANNGGSREFLKFGKKVQL